MALIHCPECGRDVSSHAPCCPGCGIPISSAGGAKPDGFHRKGTDRSKGVNLHFHLLGAVLLIVVGAFMHIGRSYPGGQPGEIVTLPVLLIAGGAAWYVVTRIRIRRNQMGRSPDSED